MRHIALAAAFVALAGCARSEDATEPKAVNSAAPADALIGPDPAAELAPVADDDALIASVVQHLGPANAPSANAKYLAGRTDLDGDLDEDGIVYLIDPAFCGTGGCPVYVSRQGVGGMNVISTIGPAQLPIYALAKGADGWHELGITVGGGGTPRTLKAVPHGPTGYADNPTEPPAREASSEGASLLIADDMRKAMAVPQQAAPVPSGLPPAAPPAESP